MTRIANQSDTTQCYSYSRKTPTQAMEDVKAKVPAKFGDYRLGAGMMTGPGGNFEPMFRELRAQLPQLSRLDHSATTVKNTCPS